MNHQEFDPNFKNHYPNNSVIKEKKRRADQ